jgi:hypothetical protein
LAGARDPPRDEPFPSDVAADEVDEPAVDEPPVDEPGSADPVAPLDPVRSA